MTIKAIETEYKGYRFRSRLEARWAVFFDALGVEWEYEIEGFEIDGIKYLPDFRIKCKSVDVYSWLEIKPAAPIDELDREKCASFAKAGNMLTIVRGDPYMHFSNERQIYSYTSWMRNGEEREIDIPFTLVAVGAMSAGDCLEVHKLWEQYGDGQRFLQESFVYLMEPMTSANVAAKKARSARFEHGESGG